MGFILFIVSLVLGCLIVPLMILINSFIYIINLDFIGLNDYFMRMAIGKDQNGGVAGDRTFNFLLLKEHSKRLFGNVDETISSVLG